MEKIYTEKDPDLDKLELLGAFDELHSFIGLGKSIIKNQKHKALLNEAQINISKILTEIAGYAPSRFPKVTFRETLTLMRQTEEWRKTVSPVKKFVTPGQTTKEALLHFLRVSTRRAERTALKYQNKYGIRKEIINYLDQLSYFFFHFSLIAEKQNQKRG